MGIEIFVEDLPSSIYAIAEYSDGEIYVLISRELSDIEQIHAVQRLIDGR